MRIKISGQNLHYCLREHRILYQLWPNTSRHVVLLMASCTELWASTASFSQTFNVLRRFFQTVMKAAPLPIMLRLQVCGHQHDDQSCCSVGSWAGSGGTWTQRCVALQCEVAAAGGAEGSVRMELWQGAGSSLGLGWELWCLPLFDCISAAMEAGCWMEHRCTKQGGSKRVWQGLGSTGKFADVT